MCVTPEEITEGFDLANDMTGLFKDIFHTSSKAPKLNSECSTTLTNHTAFELLISDRTSLSSGNALTIKTPSYRISSPANIIARLKREQVSDIIGGTSSIMQKIDPSMYSTVWSYAYDFETGFGSSVTYNFLLNGEEYKAGISYQIRIDTHHKKYDGEQTNFTVKISSSEDERLKEIKFPAQGAKVNQHLFEYERSGVTYAVYITGVCGLDAVFTLTEKKV